MVGGSLASLPGRVPPPSRSARERQKFRRDRMLDHMAAFGAARSRRAAVDGEGDAATE
jgi:hypothetical protein